MLAVGDAAFAQKCMDVFHERRAAGKTIVLVTHDMTTVQTLCHRAMLLHDGELRYVGEPEEAALRYYRLNFGGVDARRGPAAILDINARVVEAALRDAPAARSTTSSRASRCGSTSCWRRAASWSARDSAARAQRRRPGVFGFTRTLGRATSPRASASGSPARSRTGSCPASYSLDVLVREDGAHGRRPRVQGLRLLDFVVYGTAPGHGVVTVRADVEAVLEEPQP